MLATIDASRGEAPRGHHNAGRRPALVEDYHVSFTQLLAGLGLVVCLALGVRMAVGPRRRARFDRWVLLRSGALRTRARRGWQWGRERHQQRQARRMADDVIRRARSGSADPSARKDGASDPSRAGAWEGNVFRPDRFDANGSAHPDRRQADRQGPDREH